MRYALVYGLLSGTIIIAVILSGILLAPDSPIFSSVWFGYLVMVVAMTFIFVGVRRYRDVEKGGVIRFLPALVMGLAIALVAVIAYVLVWEIYLAVTHYAFIDTYFGGTDPESMAWRIWYSNPLNRAWTTALELAPVGLAVALVSAGLLRNPRLLPAKRPTR
jgi:polyferredoxin